MSNTEWKKGYEEGFAAGWKAAAKQDELNYKNFPPVYHGAGTYTIKPVDKNGYTATMAETPSTGNPYGVKTVLLNEDC